MRVSFLFCLNMMEGNKYDGLWNEFLCYALLFYTKQFWAIFFKLSKNWITQKSSGRLIFLKFRIYSIVLNIFQFPILINLKKKRNVLKNIKSIVNECYSSNRYKFKFIHTSNSNSGILSIRYHFVQNISSTWCTRLILNLRDGNSSFGSDAF